jgi:N-acetylmuramoyl-L-alanine amidase
VVTGPDGTRVVLHDGTPFVRWGDALVQLADAPYFDVGDLHVPLQFLTDVLPSRLPQTYRLDGGALAWGPARRADQPAAQPSPTGVAEAPPPQPAASPRTGERRVVVIDAGHGGEDPGTVSRSGIREKVVALGVAQAMAQALKGVPGLEIHMIRDADVLVPIWDRGAKATQLKGESPGVLVSIHANSAGSGNPNARGFETYFLSEARTEHERRVAAIENAPLGVEAVPEAGGGDLDFILRELKNLDQQHWSSLMAELVQEEVARIHPGPDRGVKQAPLAVITNAIMPAVLVEIGYLSHAEEARLLAQPAFQREAGQALARAVSRFFQRYPPGSGASGGAAR